MPKPNKIFPHDAMEQANAMRDKALANAMKRKEEYLGARVPKELKERVILRAAEMEIPVSLLIRRVLEDVFSDERATLQLSRVFPPIEANSVCRDHGEVNPMLPYETLSNAVIAWQLIELNQSRSCKRCQKSLVVGDQALWGVTTLGDNEYVIICRQCKQTTS